MLSKSLETVDLELIPAWGVIQRRMELQETEGVATFAENHTPEWHGK